MAIKNWTDKDYAQAAIDMLPGSVEEIEEFLRAQRIPSKWVGLECPIRRWVEKWTDGQAGAGWENVHVYTPNSLLPTPEPVQAYILYVDRKCP